MKTLAKEHGWLVANQGSGDPANPAFTLDALSNGWRIVNAAGSFVSDTYFDLAGMSQQEKTLFFEGIAVQELLAPIVFNGQPGDSMIVADIMTSSPLTDTEAANFPIVGNFAYTSAVLTFDQTIFARVNQYVIDLDTAQWGSMSLRASNQVGSMSATASDRVYSYRVVLSSTPFNGTRFDLSPARHLLQAIAKEEPEFQYLMRLKRSYELQQSYDED